jgi:hypothetical protein
MIGLLTRIRNYELAELYGNKKSYIMLTCKPCVKSTSYITILNLILNNSYHGVLLFQSCGRGEEEEVNFNKALIKTFSGKTS